MDECETCGSDLEVIECPDCEGEGGFTDGAGVMSGWRTCGTCDGTGQVIGCPDCGE